MADVIAEIAAERRRQIEVEGWDTKHDDDFNDSGELAAAAGCYALASCDLMDWMRICALDLWPWKRDWWKPRGRRRDLIRAAALIVAEIERLDRAQEKAS